MISDYFVNVRAWAKEMDIELPYLWVAELQADRLRDYKERIEAVVHYHVVFCLPVHLRMPKADACGWWPHGMTRTEIARKPIGYLAKYVAKGDGQQFPRGIRLHGSGGLDAPTRDARRWWTAPLYVRGQMCPADRPMRCSGGFLSRVTGEFIESPFTVQCIRNRKTYAREIWVHSKEEHTDAEISVMNESHVAASRSHARAAGYVWLDGPQSV